MRTQEANRPCNGYSVSVTVVVRLCVDCKFARVASGTQPVRVITHPTSGIGPFKLNYLCVCTQLAERVQLVRLT